MFLRHAFRCRRRYFLRDYATLSLRFAICRHTPLRFHFRRDLRLSPELLLMPLPFRQRHFADYLRLRHYFPAR